MHLVEIFLPTTFPDGRKIGDEIWYQVRDELVEQFGGLTAHDRAPAQGIWKGDRDEIVIVDVMCDELDPVWWTEFRGRLEALFDQSEILIRATTVRRL